MFPNRDYRVRRKEKRTLADYSQASGHLKEAM